MDHAAAQVKSSRRRPIATLLILAACFLAALGLRSYFVHDRVFAADQVQFHEADPWYHVRIIENLVHNFPHRLNNDPYALHPGGQYVPIGPFFDLLTAGIALSLGAGRPSTALIHAVCAWVPPILGALVVLPVYFLGRQLRGAACGLVAAASIAILPSLFLHRSLLGFTDHHVAECLFSALALLALIAAANPHAAALTMVGSEFPVPRTRRRSIIWTASAGILLGLYLLTWIGGALLILMICAVLSALAISAHVRGGSAAAVALIGAGVTIVAGLFVLPYVGQWPYEYHVAALGAAAWYFLLLALLAAWARRQAWSGWWLIMSTLLLVLVGCFSLWLAAPNIALGALDSMRRFAGGSAGEFVIEASPLFMRDGKFTSRPAFEMFSISLVTGFVGLLAVVLVAVRCGSAASVVVAVWSLAVLAATLRQQRFAYYLSINAALLSGYFWGVLGEWLTNLADRFRIPRLAAGAAGIIVVLGLGIAPFVGPAMRVAADYNGPHPDWRHALQWLRDNSPEPFGSPDVYLRGDHGVPELSAEDRDGYGVLCWWDAGYWVTFMARRSPTANPTQAGARETAEFLIAQNEADAAGAMNRLGARYAVLDGTLPVWRSEATNALIGKFGAVIRWTGGSELDYYEPYLLPMGGDEYKPIVLYYPTFYRSMLTRLYIFGGRPFVPDNMTWLVRYTEVPYRAGEYVKRIDDTVQFPTYQAAVEHMRTSPGNWRMVGLAFGESCVPLEPLQDFRQVYKSPTVVAEAAGQSISHVEIFEYIPK